MSPRIPERPRLRIVAHDDLTAEDVEDAALDLDWLLVGNWQQTNEHPALTSFLDQSERTRIDYVEDAIAGFRYFDVVGRFAYDVERDIRATFPTYSADKALDALRTAPPDERPGAVLLAALGAGSSEHALVEALRSAAADENPAVRRSVVLGVGYVGWPALVELLAELNRTDPDPDVREDAATMIQVLEEIASGVT